MFKKILIGTTLSLVLVSCASDAKKDDGNYMVETRNDTMTNANPVNEMESKKTLNTTEIKSELNEENIYFAFDSDQIKKTEKEKLRDVARMINSAPSNARIIVAGYTDAVGSETYNKDLAMRRAKSAKATLVEFGVSPSRLELVSFGESKANTNVDNDTDTSWGFKDEDRKVSFMLRTDSNDGMSQSSTTSSEMY